MLICSISKGAGIVKEKCSKKKKVSVINTIKYLFPKVILAAPVFFVITNISGLCHGFFYGALTYQTQVLFDKVELVIQEKKELNSMMTAIILLIAVALILQISNGLHNFLSENLVSKINGALQQKMNWKLQKIEPVLFEKKEFLEMLNKAQSGMLSSISLVTTLVTLMTFYLPYYIFISIYLYAQSPILIVLMFCIFIPTVLTQIVKTRIFKTLEDNVAPIRLVTKHYEECICSPAYMKESRINNLFSFFWKKYNESNEQYITHVIGAEKKSLCMELGMKAITLIGYLFILIFMVELVVQQKITVGAFAAIIASLGRMFGLMEEIICYHIGQLTRDLGAVSNYINFMCMDIEEKKEELAEETLQLTCKNTCFKYPNQQSNVIEQVNLVINPGETIAIVGENGSGKTTLSKLLMGLYDPTEGAVLWNGKETSQLHRSSKFHNVSGVFQFFQKYKMSLGENVSIGEISNQDETRIKEKLKEADIAVTSEKYPNGIDTMLSREFDGIDLSGGQWQRIAIARGLYPEHSFIVLDEPTAAIDPIEENFLYEKFLTLCKGKTAILISHRLGSVKQADRIIVMKSGKIDAIGTHEELMKQEGLYYKMYMAQAKWYV